MNPAQQPEQPKHKRETDHKSQQLPVRSDRIPMELHFERVPNIFLGDDRNGEVRTATQKFRAEDGSHGSMTFNIIPSRSAGDLTPDTRRAFVALQRMIADKLADHDPDKPLPTRFDFKLREFNRYLNPRPTRDEKWGKSIRAGIKRQIRKLQQVNFEIHTEWYDKATDTKKTVEDGFSIIAHYHIAESKQFKSGAEQPALEMGYVDVLPMLVRNVASGYTSPLLADVQNAIRSKWGRVLYQHLDNRFAGIPKGSKYRRKLKALFEEDFPELATKYPYPNHRKRVTDKALKELIGKPITTGTIKTARIVKTKDDSEWMLEVTRTYNEMKPPQLDEESTDGSILISRADEDDRNSFSEWAKHSPANTAPRSNVGAESIGDLIRERQPIRPPEQPVTQPPGRPTFSDWNPQEGDWQQFVATLTAVLHDEKSLNAHRRKYWMLQRLKRDERWARETLYRLAKESQNPDEHPNIQDKPAGQRFEICYAQYCREALHVEPYQSSSPHE